MVISCMKLILLSQNHLNVIMCSEMHHGRLIDALCPSQQFSAMFETFSWVELVLFNPKSKATEPLHSSDLGIP